MLESSPEHSCGQRGHEGCRAKQLEELCGRDPTEPVSHLQRWKGIKMTDEGNEALWGKPESTEEIYWRRMKPDAQKTNVINFNTFK